jgi:hypothetical protein
MDFKAFQESGRRLLVDTKQRKAKGAKKPDPSKDLIAPAETDPYRVFVRRVVSERPGKAEIVKDIERFIKAAEELL